MTKLQEIKNKVYCLKWGTDSIEEAKKKELVFGCMVDVGWAEPHYVKVLKRLISNNFSICNYKRNTKYLGGQEIIEYQDNFSIERTPIKEIKEILGTNISLADILMAIKKSGEYFCLMPSDDNNVDFLKVVEDGYEYLAEWDTSNDSLDWHAEHKPETIEFLHSIICK